jgi:hypothetical protein
VTTKADVFSFGVILMELLTGRRAVDETLPEEDMYLVAWFATKMRSRQEAVFRSMIDPTIRDIDDETTFKSLTTVAELAGHCTAREPAQRPDMGHVVSVLRPLVDEWKPMSMDYNAEASSRESDMTLAGVEAVAGIQGRFQHAEHRDGHQREQPPRASSWLRRLFRIFRRPMRIGMPSLFSRACLLESV